MNKAIKRLLLTTLMLILLVTVAACGNTNESTLENSDVATEEQDQVTKKVRIGSKDFTENLIVSELYALALENAGFDVERVPNIAGSIIHASIINDEIDLYPEYTGTGLLSILKEPLLTDPEEVYQTVKAGYD